MAFFTQAITVLQTLVIALGAGLGIWGVINLLEGYGNDNPGAKSQGIDELASWVMEHRLEVCHWFTVDTFTHLKHGGRVSGAAAAMGTALQIKPLLHVDSEGKLQAVEKPRGRKKAVTTQIARMEQGWKPELGKSILIGHADDPEAADMLKERLLEQFPDSEICIAYDVLSDNPALTSLNGNAATGKITFTSSIPDGSLSADIVNQSGATLPETGGIGTTIFYLVGGLLVVGAGILLITRKRMSGIDNEK